MICLYNIVQGRSALHYAAALKDNTYIYQTLIKHGADTSLLDAAGNTPGHYAKNRRDLNKEKLMDFLHSSPTAILPREKAKPERKIAEGLRKAQTLPATPTSLFNNDATKDTIDQAEKIFSKMEKAMKEKPDLARLVMDRATFDQLKTR